MISVITVTYNSADVLQQFWSAPGAERTGYEWIVVDNASVDGSAEVAEALGARVIRLDRNLGFSAANNIGASASAADVLMFCNPDVAVDAAGVEALAARVRADDGIWAPQLVNADGSPQENGRGFPFLWSKVKHLLRIDDPAYARVAEPDQVRDVVWVMGAAVAVARRTFHAIGGWDAGFFIYYEDADICLRALAAGYRVRVDGSIRWIHGWARETGRGFSLRAWRFEVRAASRFYRKHPRYIPGFGRADGSFRPAGAAALEAGALR